MRLQSDNWNAFQDSLNWNNNRFQHENIQDLFLEAMRLGVDRQKAFIEVIVRIRRTGKSITLAVMHNLWHTAGCQWKARQHSQVKIQPLPIHPAVNGHGFHQMIREQEIVKIHKYDSGVDIVIDGLNVIYGTPSHQKPSLMNLLAPLPVLQERKLAFKCYFDANTYFRLKEAGKHDEADAYLRAGFGKPVQAKAPVEIKLFVFSIVFIFFPFLFFLLLLNCCCLFFGLKGRAPIARCPA